jgi:hypothetical protein
LTIHTKDNDSPKGLQSPFHKGKASLCFLGSGLCFAGRELLYLDERAWKNK